MAFDAAAADRVRAALFAHPEAKDISERKMMGALVFMAGDKMCCGVTGFGAEALSQPHVRPFSIGGGRRPKGFVLIDPPGWQEDADLAQWLTRALAFTSTLTS